MYRVLEPFLTKFSGFFPFTSLLPGSSDPVRVALA
jgi:hypothetical protein